MSEYFPRITFGYMHGDTYKQQKVFANADHIGWSCHNMSDDPQLAHCIYSPNSFEMSRRLGLWTNSGGSAIQTQDPQALRDAIRRIVRRG